jgi:flagellin
VYLNTNMSALEAIQALNNTTTQENNSIQELATGNRITSAASDPAGLAITQLMQSQINGLNQANQNAQNGVSLLQTADGALANIDTILQSMRSLASEAATGTNNAGDLQNLQLEMNQYAQEITNISNTTQFNNINLLAGGFQNQSIQIGANEGQSLSLNINASDAVSLKVAGMNALVSSDGIGIGGSLQLGAGLQANTSYQVVLTGDVAASVGTYTASGAAFTGVTAGSITGTFDSAATTTYTVTVASVNTTTNVMYLNVVGSDGLTTTITAATTATSISFTDGSNTVNIGGVTFGTTPTTDVGQSLTFSLTPAEATFELQTSSGTLIGSAVTVVGYNALTSTITVGDATTGQNANGELATFQLTSSSTFLNLTSITSTAFTPSTATTKFTAEYAGQVAGASNGGYLSPANYASVSTGLNISNQASAAAAMNIIDSAIQQVDNQRASIGAWMNQLSFAESNAQTESTNLQSANAGYLNANMPQVTAQFMQQQVLVQADVGLLAQADQLPADLLKLIP